MPTGLIKPIIRRACRFANKKSFEILLIDLESHVLNSNIRNKIKIDKITR